MMVSKQQLRAIAFAISLFCSFIIPKSLSLNSLSPLTQRPNVLRQCAKHFPDWQGSQKKWTSSSGPTMMARGIDSKKKMLSPPQEERGSSVIGTRLFPELQGEGTLVKAGIIGLSMVLRASSTGVLLVLPVALYFLGKFRNGKTNRTQKMLISYFKTFPLLSVIIFMQLSGYPSSAVWLMTVAFRVLGLNLLLKWGSTEGLEDSSGNTKDLLFSAVHGWRKLARACLALELAGHAITLWLGLIGLALGAGAGEASLRLRHTLCGAAQFPFVHLAQALFQPLFRFTKWTAYGQQQFYQCSVILGSLVFYFLNEVPNQIFIAKKGKTIQVVKSKSALVDDMQPNTKPDDKEEQQDLSFQSQESGRANSTTVAESSTPSKSGEQILEERNADLTRREQERKSLWQLEEEGLALLAQKKAKKEQDPKKRRKEQLAAKQKAEEAQKKAEKKAKEELQKAERAEKERLEAEKTAEEERAAAEQAEKERLEAERKAKEEKAAAKQAEQERIEAKKMAEEKRAARAAKQAEEARLAQEAKAAAMAESEAAEPKAKEAEKAAANLIVSEQAEEARLAKEKEAASKAESETADTKAKAMEAAPEMTAAGAAEKADEVPSEEQEAAVKTEPDASEAKAKGIGEKITSTKLNQAFTEVEASAVEQGKPEANEANTDEPKETAVVEDQKQPAVLTLKKEEMVEQRKPDSKQDTKEDDDKKPVATAAEKETREGSALSEEDPDEGLRAAEQKAAASRRAAAAAEAARRAAEQKAARERRALAAAEAARAEASRLAEAQRRAVAEAEAERAAARRAAVVSAAVKEPLGGYTVFEDDELEWVFVPDEDSDAEGLAEEDVLLEGLSVEEIKALKSLIQRAEGQAAAEEGPRTSSEGGGNSGKEGVSGSTLGGMDGQQQEPPPPNKDNE